MLEMGFELDEDSITAVVPNPLEVFQGYSGRTIAQGNLDNGHVLRVVVVYEEGQEITPGNSGSDCISRKASAI